MYFHEYNFDDFNIEDKFNYKMKEHDVIMLDAKVGFNENDKDTELCFFEVFLSNGVSDNVYIDERIFINCSRTMLTLIKFSFDFAEEKDLNNLSSLIDKHIKLIEEAIDNRNFDFFFKIVCSHFERQRVIAFSGSCDDENKMLFSKRKIKTIEDIQKVINCYNNCYDSVKTMFKHKIITEKID